MAGGSAVAAAFDVTDLDAVQAGLADHPRVDILVNNAGNGGAEQMRPKPFREMAPAEWESPIEVNLRGVLNCVHAVITPMVEAGWGRIITISSGAGSAGVDIGVAPYSAGKGGGLGFMRSLALENAPFGVTANSVALGLMNNVAGCEFTELGVKLDPETIDQVADFGVLTILVPDVADHNDDQRGDQCQQRRVCACLHSRTLAPFTQPAT